MSHGLAPRPAPTVDEVAAVVAAMSAVASSMAASIDGAPAWRFAGRWFNAGRYANRRPIVTP